MSWELRSLDLGALSVITGSILMGSLVVFVRNIPLHPIQISFFRMFLGFLFLSIPIILSGRKPVINNPRIMGTIIVINTVVITSYITAVQMIEAATAALLLYMAPIYVLPAAIIDYMVFGELLESEQVMGGMLILVSVAMAWKKIERVKIRP